MEKNYHSSTDSNTSNSISSSNNNNDDRDHYLRQVNKISHKISKPFRKNPIDHPPHLLLQNPNQKIQEQEQKPQQIQQQQHHHHHQQQQQPLQQPPVYNINKSDFRDVVQKLTGSPSHDRFSTPPPIHPPKPPSSRLQRIRPPPLAQISNRPPHSLNNPIPGPKSPLSPLPPLPSVHVAAESPISAYMRFLHNSISTSDSESKRYSGVYPLVSPRWNNATSLQEQTQQVLLSPTTAMAPSQFLMPSSPLAFGKIPSPRSPYPLLSPTLLFSPSKAQLGFPQFPQSPRFPVPSPRWSDL